MFVLFKYNSRVLFVPVKMYVAAYVVVTIVIEQYDLEAQWCSG